jgi:hypothetical protein
MLDDFMTRAALAGVGVALAAAPLGSFVVWRRMAYFGDATAHAAILGVALSLALQISVFAGAVAVALAMALTVTVLSGRGYAMDTLLGVLAHSALAFGLVAVSFLSGIRIDLMAYLFGDILAVSRGDLAVIWGGAALVVGLIGWRWSALLTSTISAELAHASGIDPKREQLILTLAQGGRRPADCRHADHSRRCRPPLVAHPRADGSHRRHHRQRVCRDRIARGLCARHAGWPNHRLRRRNSVSWHKHFSEPAILTIRPACFHCGPQFPSCQQTCCDKCRGQAAVRKGRRLDSDRAFRVRI